MELHISLWKWLLIFLGSGLGGLLRYLLGVSIQTWCASCFPWGTLTINVSGCFLIGFLATLWAGDATLPAEYKAGILVGFLGGYTTFSTFGYETISLLNNHRTEGAVSYVLASVLVGLLAVWCGQLLARQF